MIFIRPKSQSKEIPENTKEIGAFLFFRLKILKWTLDFRPRGCIVEVLTENLTFVGFILRPCSITSSECLPTNGLPLSAHYFIGHSVKVYRWQCQLVLLKSTCSMPWTDTDMEISFCCCLPSTTFEMRTYIWT